MNKLLFLFTIIYLHVFGQATRGAFALPTTASSATGRTYAVIIGISTYQNIEKLQFADKDAKAFYCFLRSKSGGAVDSGNIKLLLNRQARKENMIYCVGKWLTDYKRPKTGDKVFIYFAGHSDAIAGKGSWLLGWDVPNTGDPAVDYDGGGGIQIEDLKKRLLTLADSGVKVILITDACRGNENLSGGEKGHLLADKELTSYMEMKAGIQFASCSAGEVSVEGDNWGGGRGLFSYWFVNGLYGMADKDNDGIVTALELREYVEENVTQATKKKDNSHVYYEQNPFYCCSENNSENITKVDTIKKRVIKEMISTSQNYQELLTFTCNKASNDPIANMSGKVETLHNKFESEIENDTTADFNWKEYLVTYRLLMKQKVSDELRLTLKDELVIALYNHSQQVMNFFVENKKYLSNTLWTRYFSNTVLCLDSAVLFIDKNNPLYNEIRKNLLILKAETYFGMGGDYNEKLNKDLMYSALKDLDTARSLNSKPAAVLSHAYANIYYALDKPAESLKYEIEANTIAPNWTTSLCNIGFSYVHNYSYDTAKKYYNKVLQLDNSFYLAWGGLGYISYQQNNYDLAGYYYGKSLQLDSNFLDALIFFGIKSANEKKYSAAEYYYLKALKTNPNVEVISYRLADCYSIQNNKKSAYKYLEQSLINPSVKYTFIKSDSNLNNIRNTAKFNSLMKKYFPDEYGKN